MNSKIARLTMATLLAVISIGGHAATGDPVDWYLTVTFDNWTSQSSTQFVESGTAGVYTIDNFTTTGSFNFGVRNSSWGTQYGWVENVTAVGQDFSIANTGACNGWASIPAGTYDVTVNLTAFTIRFDTHDDSGGGSSVSDGFVRGADISWCTEMEADGVKFYNAAGVETDIFALMKEIGMTAIRLRVWVNPSTYGYGAWCDKADVVAKAKRAAAQGLDLMIDFHYSDFFADPVRQTKPVDWSSYNNTTNVSAAIRTHTLDVLNALKAEGITPKWVQVGNETRLGMVWSVGKISNGDFSNYVTLSNAGYAAVKEVFPNAIVIVHLNNAYDYHLISWFNSFASAGGNFDMIGVSHYPDYDNWNSSSASHASNPTAASNIATLASTFGKKVMVVETGFESSSPALAKTVMQDLFDRVTAIDDCAGIFYWEPEVYGDWKPSYYNTVGWNAYSMGAFTSTGKPSQTLEPFMTQTSQSPDVLALFDAAGENILGYLNATSDGVYSGTITADVDYLTFQVVDEYNNVWYRTVADDRWTLTTDAGGYMFWLDEAASYSITVDLTTGTWSFERVAADTDFWYLYSFDNSWEFDKPFTQSETDSDVFTLENFTVTSDNLDAYGGLSFRIIAANWAEAYSYGATITATGTYELSASGTSGVWENIYATVFQPGVPYTLTWNRSTHEFTIASGISELVLDSDAAIAPAHSAGYYNLTLNHWFKGGKWNMVCLPISLSEEALIDHFGEGVKLAKFSGAIRTTHTNGSGAPRRQSANIATGTAEFTTCTDEGMAANTPYLLQPTQDVQSLEIDNIWVEASQPATVTQGYYSLVGTDVATTATAGNYFTDDEGEFTRAAGGENIPAMSAYFTGANGSSLENEGLSISIDNIVTGIDSIITPTEVADNRVYNMQGQCMGTTLNALPQGIYIVNHRKVIVGRR